MRKRQQIWVDVGFSVLILILVVWFFRGWLGQGMDMDEVTRVTNLMPIFHADAQPTNQSFYDIEVLGHRVPLMYKEYISTAYLVRFLPLVLFDDYVLGIRVLHLLYFLGACLALYFLVRPLGRLQAAMVTLLYASCPLIYPLVRVGFADTFHLIFLAGAIFLVARYLGRPEHRLPVLGASFLLFFTANQAFYFAWVIAGLGLATLLLFPDRWWRFLHDWKAVGLAAAGAGLGLIHFVIYNLADGFPTFRVLYLKLLFPDEYNKTPVDLTPAQPLPQEIIFKLGKVYQFLSSAAAIHLVVLAIVVGISLWAAIRTIRSGAFRQHRVLFLPLLAFLIIFGLILISPKTHREGHYVYLSPFWELAVMAASGPLALLLTRRSVGRVLALVLPLGLLCSNLWTSNGLVSAINRTGGTGLFSPAVFDYVGYLNSQRIDSRNVVFLTWGLYAQPYFINKGRFHLNSLVYALYDVTDPARQDKLITEFLYGSDSLATRLPESVYFPLYRNFRPDLNQALHRVVERYGGKAVIEASFPERNGAPAIDLHRVDGFRRLRSNILAAITNTRLSEQLKITDFGPRQTVLPTSRPLAMWFIGEHIAPTVRVCFEGEPLRTMSGPTEPRWTTSVTAAVPIHRLTSGGAYEITLCDLERGIHSAPVQLQVFDLPSLQSSEELVIENFGPRQVPFPADKAQAMWFGSNHLTPSAKVCFQGRALRTTPGPPTPQYRQVLTASVPVQDLEEPGEYEIFLCDAERGIRSAGVSVRLVIPPPVAPNRE